MKYFTPELFVQGNSDDPDDVDFVEAAWENAIERYTQRFEAIKPQLPENLRRFEAEQCLHDADVLSPAWNPPGSANGSCGEVIFVAQQVNTLYPEFQNTLAILKYAAVAEPTVAIPVVSEVFKDVQPNWLYDEIDVVEPGVFSHEVLLSNGQVVKILFRDFEDQIAELVRPEKTIYHLLRNQEPAASA